MNDMPNMANNDVTGTANIFATATAVTGAIVMVVVYLVLQAFGVVFNFYHGVYVVLGLAALVWVAVFVKETTELQRKAAERQARQAMLLETIDP